MKRIDEFTKHGKKYIYFDMSYFATNDEFRFMIEISKEMIEKHKPHSIYTIVNLEGIRFDTETKMILVDWMKRNEPYVKHCLLVGMDGIKKIMLNSALELSGRRNVGIAAGKEQAIEMLKQKEWDKWDRWGQI